MASELGLRVVLVLSLAACATPAPPAVTPPSPGNGAGPVQAISADATTPSTPCTEAQPAPEYVCTQECGPPVAHQGDPPPPWRWYSPADVENRKKYGCPRCLPPETRIATPDGDVPISALPIGARIYTIDPAGHRVDARVLHAGSSPVGRGHQIARVQLADGRTVAASPGHPDANGRRLGDLHVGDVLDGSAVVGITLAPFAGERTWDVLPSGTTGLYIANGVVLRSTWFASQP